MLFCTWVSVVLRHFMRFLELKYEKLDSRAGGTCILPRKSQKLERWEPSAYGG